MQGAWGMLLGFMVQAAPLSDDFVDRKFDPELAKDIKFYLSLALVAGGVLRTAYGRHQATEDIITPDILPGRNRADVERNSINS